MAERNLSLAERAELDAKGTLGTQPDEPWYAKFGTLGKEAGALLADVPLALLGLPVKALKGATTVLKDPMPALLGMGAALRSPVAQREAELQQQRRDQQQAIQGLTRVLQGRPGYEDPAKALDAATALVQVPGLGPSILGGQGKYQRVGAHTWVDPKGEVHTEAATGTGKPLVPPAGAKGFFDAGGQWHEFTPDQRTSFKPPAPKSRRLAHAIEVMPDGKAHVVYRDAESGNVVQVGGIAPSGAVSEDQAHKIAQSIADGKQPPVTTGLYRNTGPVRAALADMDYDLTTANRDWTAVQKHLSTLQGPQQERLRQAVNFTYDSLDVLDNLYQQWKDIGGGSGFRILNRGALAASKQVPGEMGAVAQALEAQINDLVSELATVYKGGNASTDESLKIAAQNLGKDWNEEQFKKAVDLIRTNLRIRRNSINSSQPVGVTPGSPYLPKLLTGEAAPTPTATPSAVNDIFQQVNPTQP